MTVKRTARVCSWILLVCLIISVPFSGTAERCYASDAKPENTPYTETVNDGPYIFRHKKKVTIKYIHNNEVITKEYQIARPKYYIKITPFGREYTIPAKKAKVQPFNYKNVKKIFVVSDIHGRFDAFKRLLVKNGVVTDKMQWNWGKGHLVVNGDIFDRGPQVTEALWAVHQLELQARLKGGRVHFLLGNHEVIFLRGDYRYVHHKYIHVKDNLLKMTLRELYDENTILGQWLRTKHTVIRINDILFVHGGIHPHIIRLKLNINSINRCIRDNLDTPRDAIKGDSVLDFLFYSYGPLWYRGYFTSMPKYKRLEDPAIDTILKAFKVNHIVVGHTTQKHIRSLYGMKVIGVDSDIQSGKGEGLLWENGEFFCAGEDQPPSPLKKIK